MRETILEPRRELWHAAGRAARETRKRRIALVGLLCSAPVLVFGSLVSHLLSPGPAEALSGLGRPLAYVLAPMQRAWDGANDVALLGYLEGR